ncbi:MAG: response regulator [Clostridia bacterium]|nr:response regulator [Clostridia bacterium]
MSITKSIVDLMGGNIEVLTAPGAGTQIIIRLKFNLAKDSDIRAAQKDASPEEAVQEATVDFSTKRLLLVEDNMINMEIANMILTQAGFTVETAENGQVALDMVAASQPGHFDAVLMDIQMPVMDGYEATRAIRKLENPALASIPILAMTANAFKEDEIASHEAGMQAHIAKPIDVAILMKTLTSVLQNAQNNH